HLIFTGSTGVGRAVMRAASENLVPVTLELGGKSPVIIAPGHADAQCAASIAFGKLTNAGQTCIAPDYVLLHESDRDAFVTAYDRAVAAFYPQGPSSPDYSAIVNRRHFDRLTRLANDAAAKGADIRIMGRAPGSVADLSPMRAQTIAPMLILDPGDDMEVMQQEIFGPILPVLTYRDIDQAIAHVNARPRPLALYYFGPDDESRRKVLSRTTSGNVGINNTLLHFAQDDLPFGGVGPSGMGAYHGIEGFRALSHAKGIYAAGRWNAANLLRAPFGRLADRVLGLLLR
ncbi:MAG TPA: aldehyde dehydrogenase family protein, partial [Paracoccus sp. (in: a-proteobacteria)]|nr:aldehyde dehydrogenase family protein [Paracoccus sp. (in: a-proteobacteria)]